ncbi:PREDICTED: obscurin-like protein 1 [Crocodylus porosus]|uniref:obscurin-like protein 1 n=1 Tax=Crocodylus porosus TaxID=8502 RepID=UPI00093EFAF7|nr:PREDICTED: obscurin-like protein 1 [Crocodylus porosus]
MDVFGGAPRFLAYPRTFTVQSGADALLKCQITGDPQPSIAWEKDKAPIAPAGRFRVQAEGNMYSLLVSRVTPEDGGQYICKAKNSVGETYAAATLKVEPGEPRCEGHPDDRAPVFLARPLSLRVGRGEDVAFSCRVLGQPGPVLEWEKDGRKLSDLFESSHFCVGKEPEDWHFLRIFGSRPPDGGVYVCRARNRAGEALAAAVLLPEPWAALTNGEAAPSAPRAKAFAVSEGKHAKFRCYVTGKPKPEIVWKKDGKAVVPGRRHLAYEDREGYFILKVLYCKPQDQGLYVCTASNTAGQTLSAVQLRVREHRVRFQVQLEDVEVQEREDAVLECRVPLETIPTAWYLEDKPLQPSPKYLMEEQGRVRRLTIRDARTDDDGIYLCEMQDQGRSVAEVSVRGMIVKRLPRKLDVMEGENAAFCVETREAVEGISWRRNGQELQESPCTVLKSFGKTHLLVLVHVTREDAGIIAFAVGDSETLAQLRVKCAKRVPPSTPVAACMSTEHSNAALLTWCPAPDVHRSPPGAYVLERQEAGTAEWVQCLTTDTAGAVEVLGDSVPAEADYRFRLCAVNKYGCSAHVEFPGAAHLVPLARVERALQDAVVQEGEDAIFSLELSALVRGAWFLNGARVPEEEEEEGRRCCIWHSKTEHALQIRRVRLTEDGAEVRFVAHGLQDVAMLHVQAPQVRIVAVPEAQRVQTLPAGLPLLLECEVSRPDAPVHWLKDGEAVPGGDAITIQAEGCMRRLLVRSACPLHSGTYACDTGDDVVTFAVTVTEPPVRVVSSNETATHTYVASERVELVCELSRPDAPVQWYKDGVEVEESERLVLQRSGPCCRLVLPSAQPPDTGEYVCDAGGDSVFYNVTVAGQCPRTGPRHLAPSSLYWSLHRLPLTQSRLQALRAKGSVPTASAMVLSVPEPPVRVVSSNEAAVHAYMASERVELVCELSRPDAPVQWYKDGVEVEESERLVLQREGPCCRLVLPSAQPSDTGEYMCNVGGDSVFYSITVAEPPVQVVSSNEAAVHTYVASERVELVCELSRPNAPVQWYKDGVEVEESERLVLQRSGPCCRLVLPSAQPPDTGEYVCDVGGDSVFYNVTVAEPPVRVVSSNEAAVHTYVASERVELVCELSRPDTPVQWYKDGVEVEESERLVLQREGPCCRLVLPSAQPPDTGEYVCDAGGDSVFYNVTVAEPPVRVVSSNESAVHTYAASERVELVCELSRPDAPVQWYKDGVEVEESEQLVLQREGPCCWLVLPSAQPPDTGEYVCDAGGDSVFYNVTVAAPQVRIAPVPEAQRVRTLPAGLPLLLECEVSQPDAPVHWLKDGEAVPVGDVVTIQADGCARRLLVSSAGLSHSGMYTCDAGDNAVTFTVTVTEPPVRVVSSNEAAAHAYAASERVELVCEVSRPDAPVQWYKDGVEVVESERLMLQRSGPCCRLVLPSAQPPDTGEYVCDAGGDSVFYSVTVAEPQVRILCPQERVLELQVLVLERVELACELSVADAPVRWFKDGLEVDETDDLLLMAEGTRRCLVLPRAGTEDAGEYICETRDESVSFDVRVSEPPVRILQPWKAPPTLQACTGETVTLACELSRVSASVQWAKDGAWLEAGGSLILEEEGAHRRLVIPVAGPEHSGKYICNVGNDARTFTVQVSDPWVQILGQGDLQTQRHCRAGEDLVLEVQLSHAHGEAKWYKDGEKLQDTGRVRVEEDGARRALVVLGVESRDAGEYLCDTCDDSLIFYVTVEEPPVSIVGSAGARERRCVVAGEDLILACEVSRPNAAVRWLRDGRELAPSEHVRVVEKGCLRQLTILGAQHSDAGSYVCDAGTDQRVMSVQVAAPPIRILNKEEAALPVQAVEGDTVTLMARLSRDTAPVRWLRDRRLLRAGARLQVGSEGPCRSLTLKHAEPGDSGAYCCDAGDDAVHFTLRVREAPVLFVNKQEKQEKVLVLEGGSAVLSAVVSKEQAAVSWAGPCGAVAAGERCELRREGRVHSLVLSNVGKDEAGCYTCISRDDRMHFDVSVKELLVKFVRGLSDVHAHKGETVLLWCELCKARGDVTWLKDGQVLVPGGRGEARVEGRERSLVLSNVGPEDAGEYCCESKDDRTLAMLTVQVPRVVEIISELRNLTVMEGEDATFKCVVSPEDVALTWQLGGQVVAPSERLVVSTNGLCHALTIQQCQPGDATTVTANAEGLVSAARLSVQEAEVLFVQKLQDVVVEELQDACLEVELSHAGAEVQWLKQGVLLQPGAKYQLQEAGCRRTLTIRSLSPSDRGTYRCETLHDRTQAKLSVEPRKVMVRRPLSDVETFEKEMATFELELSHAGVAGAWARDGVRVKPGPACRLSATGCTHSLTLLALTLEDSGTVTFTADSLRCSARLTVRERPVTMVKTLRDVGIPETGAASFECELSRASVEVKWYKDGTELRAGPACRLYSVGRRRILQLSHCGLPDAGVYTCDAGDCRASATLAVYERQVHVLRELEAVHVREGENAVFTCEVSHEDVPGEWFRDGEKIKVSGTVKIRQEGTRHFLLMCSVRPEDAGQIRFVAKTAASDASLQVEALPIRIVRPLRDKTVLAQHKATLECTVSHARGRVRWFRGDTEIFGGGDKYEICNLDCYRTLVIHQVGPEDEATYTCDALDDRSSARLLVEAESVQVVRGLHSVEVVAPGEARFECEVSAALPAPPRWSLNGETLRAGAHVAMESAGRVHRLTLRHTSAGMSGVVKVALGNARSKAQLTVRGR